MVWVNGVCGFWCGSVLGLLALIVFVAASCCGLAVVRGFWCELALEGLGYLWVGGGGLWILVWFDYGLAVWWSLVDFGLDRLWIGGGGLWILV